MATRSDLGPVRGVRTRNVAAALILPFALHMIFVLALSPSAANMLAELLPSLVAINCLTGFVFMVRAVRLFAIAAAIVYFPAMVFLLLGWGRLLTWLLFAN